MEGHTHNPLKRPLDSDSEEDEEQEEQDIWDFDSRIPGVLDRTNMFHMASVLECDSEFVDLCRNILEILQKEHFCDADAHEFSKMVDRVLKHKYFLEELYKESDDECFFVAVRYYGVLTQGEAIKDRVSRIRNDKYFGQATKGGKPKMIIRGCLSIIISYCINEDDLKKMSERIGKVTEEIWGPYRYG